MLAERREKLLKELPDYSITLFRSGEAPYSLGDEKYPFEIDRTFYYYTGLDRENLNLMLIKTPKMQQTVLFIEPFDPVMAKWVGGRILREEASEISGIKDVRYNDQLEETISRMIGFLEKSQPVTLCGELSKMELNQNWPLADLFNKIRERHPAVTVRNIAGLTGAARMVKDEEEVELIRKAIAVTNQGIKAMMKSARENVWENEMEACFDFVLKCRQCGHAFHTICASGKNATVLHYGENNQQSKPGDLLLCDLGASWKYYKADITRTFPINGKFSERQREIYDLVLKANQLVKEAAKPGMTTRDLNNIVVEFYEKELPNIGLCQDGKTVRDYYWHGVSHHLGLETHDVSAPDGILKPGCVITNEPGLYLEDEGIGIRIEDDLLITEDGCICLSEAIMKDPDEIERFMAKK